jgi:hypothetical protein
LNKGIVPRVKPASQFVCRLSGNVSYEDGGSDSYEVSIRSLDTRGGQDYQVSAPEQTSSILSFRQLCKDRLSQVQAVFDELCSGAALYTDTTPLDALPERTVRDFTMSFAGNMAFQDNSSGTFNVAFTFEDILDTVPNDVGDETFLQLLRDDTFKEALEEALNLIM